MTETDSEQLFFLDARGLARRLTLVPLVLLAIAAAYYGAKWQFGRTVAETFSLADENARQTAALAVELAPADPLTVWTRATAEKSRVFAATPDAAAANFARAVQLSPNDFRYWLELGRVREQAGDRAGGERAMRRAVELAPNNAYSRWILGNLLLRDDRRDEAMAEFRRVAATHTALRQQVFYLVWESSGGDAAQLTGEFGDTPTVRAALANFYAVKNLPAESVKMWESLKPEDKTEHRVAGDTAMRIHYQKQNFHAAIALRRDLEGEAFGMAQVTNPGFETDIGAANETFFGWLVYPIKGLDVSRDLRQPRAGKFSLRIAFSGYSEPVLLVAPQVVAVETNAKYRLTFAHRTADLKSAGLPALEVIEAVTTKNLGTAALPAGTNDWQTATIEFTAPPDAQAVIVRTTRAFCGANCPIVGAIWYDDFKLERIK